MKKAFAFFLALLLILPLLPSCGEKEPAETTAATDGTTDGSVDIPTTPAVTEELPAVVETSFDGYTFVILACGNLNNSTTANDFGGTENDADVLEQAKYIRKLSVESKCDILFEILNKIKYNSCNGSGVGYKAMQESYTANAFDYDAAMIGTYDAANLAVGNMLYNINEMKEIDLSHSWWDQKAVEGLSFGKNLYLATGDIGIIDNIITHAILFNKEIVKSNSDLRDPYELVRNKAWTLDVLAEEVLKFGGDLNGDDLLDENDAYGASIWNEATNSMLASAKVRIATLKDGQLELTVNSDRAATLFDKFITLCATDKVFNYNTALPSSVWDKARTEMFDNGQILYYITTMNAVPKHRDSQTDFGILPHPMLDESQEDYSVCAGLSANMFLCFPAFLEDASRSATVMEMCAYYGKKILTPAYYERTLVGNYVRDEESIEMLDIIYSHRMYDPGLIFRIGKYGTQFSSMLGQKTNSYASILASSQRAAEADIKKINASLLAASD